MTRNVSSGGVYFETAAGQVSLDDPLSVRIGVPGHEDDAKANLTLVGSGIVRRIEGLAREHIVGSWPELQVAQGICGVAVQFQQRPTIQLHSLEELLWEDRGR